MKIVNLSEQERRDLLSLLNTSDNECYDRIIKKLKRKPIHKLMFGVIDGRFGNRVLKDQYRKYWRFMTYGTLVFLFVKFVMFPILEWWDGVVSFLNYIIWG